MSKNYLGFKEPADDIREYKFKIIPKRLNTSLMDEEEDEGQSY
jgi:hypothetical protein